MPTDVYATDDLGTEWDAIGDWRTVDGDEQLAQQIVLIVLDEAFDDLGDGITNQTLTSLTGDVYDRLVDFDRVERVREVSISDVDGTTVTLSVDTDVTAIEVPLDRSN